MNALQPEPSVGLAKLNCDMLSGARVAIEQLAQALSVLPKDIVSEIDLWAADENELEDGVPELTAQALSSIYKILPGLSVVHETSESIVRKAGPGSLSQKTGKIRGPKSRPADEWGYRVAIALGEVYQLALRKSPGPGKDGGRGTENGPFQRALITIFDSEGHSVPGTTTINNMTLAAKRELNLGALKRILAKNRATKERWAGAKVKSIATGKVQPGRQSLIEFSLWHLIHSDD